MVMRPRRLELDDLIRILVEEHGKVRDLLVKLDMLLQAGRYTEAAEELKEFQPYLDQHILDEEAIVLKALLDALGRGGAARAIKVFQEHREIHQLISEMRSAASTPEKLVEKKDRLRETLERHFWAEEKDVFPSALDVYRRKGQGSGQA